MEHERLFDEIYGKLQELSHRDTPTGERYQERLEKMQMQVKRTQEELKAAQHEIQEKIKSLDSISFAQNDMNREIRRLSEQLDQERMNNSKMSTDLAKSLELNLKLQFEIEEIRSKANQAISEEKKHNNFLQDKVKNLSHEFDLSQALCHETRLELAKAKEKFSFESSNWAQEKKTLQVEIEDHQLAQQEKMVQIESLREELGFKLEEIQNIKESLSQFESHADQQNEMMKTLSEVAEKKIIELKLALDKKSLESQDYYSHLQQAMTQVHVLRQENAALKDYISKLTALHQQKMQAMPQVQQQPMTLPQPQA